jgi:hypothetical protein
VFWGVGAGGRVVDCESVPRALASGDAVGDVEDEGPVMTLGRFPGSCSQC